MIDKQFNSYVLICDICYDEQEYFDSFDEAVEGKKELGWKSKKTINGWHDICPKCIEEVE